MARTAVTYDSLVGNGSLADPSGTALDATNGHTIASAEPERTVLRVVSTASGPALTFTVAAGDNPPALAAGQGDLDVTVASGATVFVGPLESGRFLQSDGTLSLDVETGLTGTVTAFEVPRSV